MLDIILLLNLVLMNNHQRKWDLSVFKFSSVVLFAEKQVMYFFAAKKNEKFLFVRFLIKIKAFEFTLL